MAFEEIKEKIEQIANPILASAGIELIELKVKGQKNDLSIEIIADKPMGGITIEECGTLNRAIVTYIDENLVLPPESYSLEFSSPGLDRPLMNLKDFMRVVNYDVHLYLSEAINGKKEIEGVLMNASEKGLVLFTLKKQEIVVPLEIILKGLLVI